MELCSADGKQMLNDIDWCQIMGKSAILDFVKFFNPLTI